MGEHDVDAIIAQWRASTRAAGESEEDWSVEPDVVAGWRSRRRWLAILIGLVAVAGVGVGVAMLGRPHATPIAPTTGTAPAAAVVPDSVWPAAAAPSAAAPALMLDDWFAVMSAVDRERADAYSAADGAGLDKVFVPTGPAMQQELELIARMHVQGLTAPGWSTQLIAVSPQHVDEESALLRVVDQRAQYELVGTDGTVTPVAAAAPATWLVLLQRGAKSWLVASVEPEVPRPPTAQPPQP